MPVCVCWCDEHDGDWWYDDGDGVDHEVYGGDDDNNDDDGGDVDVVDDEGKLWSITAFSAVAAVVIDAVPKIILSVIIVVPLHIIVSPI